jgi:hypothetical protein
MLEGFVLLVGNKMRSYCGDGYRQSPEGKFLGRYAEAMKRDATNDVSDRAEFNNQYKAGKVFMRLASKYMNLQRCGQDLYLEAEKKIVWSFTDGSIIRQKEDLDWVDDYLAKQEE